MKPLVFKCLLLSATFIGPLSAQAQFPLVATAPEPVSRLSTLSGGHRFISAWNPQSGTRTVYNPDFSVYRVLSFPPLTNSTGAEILMSNITEELFDTDPTTIEFAIGSVNDPSVGVRIYRENGTEIFNLTPGLGAAFDGSVFESNGVAYMLLRESNVDGPYKVYQLPGHLPCIDCHGTPAGMAVINGDDPNRGLTLYPNPTAHEVTVEVQERYAKQGASLLLLNVEGKEVGRYSLKGQSALTFSINGFASGVYQCVLLSDGIRASAKLLVDGQ